MRLPQNYYQKHKYSYPTNFFLGFHLSLVKRSLYSKVCKNRKSNLRKNKVPQPTFALCSNSKVRML